MQGRRGAYIIGDPVEGGGDLAVGLAALVVPRRVIQREPLLVVICAQQPGQFVENLGGRSLELPGLGIDSVELPLTEKIEIWDKLAGVWKLTGLTELKKSTLSLNTLSEAIETILDGEMVGRGVVDLSL